MQMEKFENTSQYMIKLAQSAVVFQNQSFNKPCIYMNEQISPFFGSASDIVVEDPMAVVVVVSNDLSLHDFHSQYKWPLEEKGIGSDLLTPEAFMAQQVVLIQESRPFIAIFL